MKKLAVCVAGLVLAGGAMAAPGETAAAREGGGFAAWGGGVGGVQRCATASSSKQFTVADPGFDAMRARINEDLQFQSVHPRAKRGRGEAYRLPDDATSFTVTLERRLCDDGGPDIGLATNVIVLPVDCNYAGCLDPLPGTGAPEGTIMILESCTDFRRVTAVFRRLPSGDWVLVSFEEVMVSSCDLDRVL